MSFMGLLGAALPGIIQGGSSLLGGMMKDSATQKANQQQMAFSWEEASRDERWRQIGQEFQERQLGIAQANRAEDLALQKEFAKSGVQWRSSDARAAGIHPLAALGAQLASSAPVQVGSFSSPSGNTISAPQISAKTGMGEAMSSMGQGLGNAVTATMAEYEKNSAFNIAMQAAQLKRAQLENKQLEMQLGGVPRSAGTSRSFPTATSNRLIPGQGNTPDDKNQFKTIADLQRAAQAGELPMVENKPYELNRHIGGRTPGVEAGVTMYQVGPAQRMLAPSQKLAESMEESAVRKFVAEAAILMSPHLAEDGWKHVGGGLFVLDSEGLSNKYGDKGFHRRAPGDPISAKRWIPQYRKGGV